MYLSLDDNVKREREKEKRKRGELLLFQKVIGCRSFN
jgi:hypothetical protein